ncbi:MAG: NifB/NifX family molybdenum-iron cluster-binding protein [Deltaproteobacteria bacterium]|nr:NifB/NifX family molybdenum-iron cluster-binding protein [Deltaproteobacteria bacterium]
MKIAVSAEGPDLDSRVGERFGISRYLLIVDSDTMAVEAYPNPGASSPGHAGIHAVILAIAKAPEVLITGYLSPTAEKYLTGNGIRVVRGAGGRVSDALASCLRDPAGTFPGPGKEARVSFFSGDALLQAVRGAGRQFGGMIPVMVGVVLLVGLFQAFAGKAVLASFLGGGGFPDMVRGALAGSLFAGNPVNSYIIGGELLAQGVGLSAVTAFMVAWVSVGLLQLPAEIEALGGRFALLRNALSFLASLGIAAGTVAAWGYLGG